MTVHTPKEIAGRFGTDPRTLRKFLRSDAKANGTETPGKGSRWAIEARTLKSLQKRFNAWDAAQKAAKAAQDAHETHEVTDEA